MVKKILSWTLLAFSLSKAIFVFVALPSLTGFVSALSYLFMGALAFWGLRNRTTAQADALQSEMSGRSVDNIVESLRPSRLQFAVSDDAVSLHVPSRPREIAIGITLAIIPLWALTGSYDFYLELLRVGPTQAMIARALLLFVMLPVLAFVCPWWWFLGGESIHLSRKGLLYESGVWPFRRRRTFEWHLVLNLRPTTPRLLEIGYQILFGYAPELGMTHGIGRHLTSAESREVLELLKKYQAGIVDSNPAPVFP